jgi:hypothetical protein
MIKKTFLALVLLIVFACNNGAEESLNNEVLDQNETKELIVGISFKTNKTDNFRIMLNNVIVDEFQKKNMTIIEDVYPTTSVEKLVANFGRNNMSKSFQFGLGNKERKEVEFVSMHLSYGANVLDINASELSKYFTFNKYVLQDKNNNKVLTQSIDGKHWPLLIMKKEAIKLLSTESL